MKLLKGDRPLSQMETLCIERLINDHKRAKSAGLVWHEDKAMQAVEFFDYLQHYKGKFAGQPLSLQPWQRDCIVKPLFGWYREDGSRRYRQSYIEVPRKNGKTTMTAGFALKGLLMDGEQGAEVYAAATKREQAKILFDDCGRVLSPAIKKRVRVLKNAITFEKMNASLKAVSSDYNTLDGLNPHICVVDELHAHKERGLYDVMMSGMGARFSPLMVAITTAGVDRASICWEQREILRNAIEGHVEHDACGEQLPAKAS
jgi:phage terminase large subunit-like protein